MGQGLHQFMGPLGGRAVGNTNAGNSIVMRSLRRLPLLRAYPALQDVREQLRAGQIHNYGHAAKKRPVRERLAPSLIRGCGS